MTKFGLHKRAKKRKAVRKEVVAYYSEMNLLRREQAVEKVKLGIANKFDFITYITSIYGKEILRPLTLKNAFKNRLLIKELVSKFNLTFEPQIATFNDSFIINL